MKKKNNWHHKKNKKKYNQKNRVKNSQLVLLKLKYLKIPTNHLDNLIGMFNKLKKVKNPNDNPKIAYNNKKYSKVKTLVKKKISYLNK